VRLMSPCVRCVRPAHFLRSPKCVPLVSPTPVCPQFRSRYYNTARAPHAHCTRTY
jgi:hypothetical protein